MQPFSSKALHFLALSVKVHIEKLEADLAATDDEDEQADYLNDTHYLRCLLKELDERQRALEATLGTSFQEI